MLDKYGYTITEIERQGYSVESRDSVLVYSDIDAINEIIRTYDPLPEAKIDAVLRINEQSQTHMQSIEDEYPEFEKRTWPTQKAEVEAWKLNNSYATPTLDVIATARGIDRITLLNKTYEKVQSYNLMAASLAGKRQALEDSILNSTDLDFICNVNFEA